MLGAAKTPNEIMGEADHLRGNALMHLGMYAEAAEAYAAALNDGTYGKRGALLTNRGKALAAVGDYTTAAQAFSAATQDASYATPFKAYLGLGNALFQSGDYANAGTAFRQAAIDGANRWQQTWHVTLPGMRMIIVLMMVLSLGNVLNAGFDQVYNMYNPVVYETGDIIDTMVYRLGLESAKYSPATAVSMFKSLVSLLFISSSYYVAIKFFDYRLF